MADLFGDTLSKRELLERVGDISQVCGARLTTYADGLSTGVQAIEVTTGSGLRFTVLPSRGLDIADASFMGTPIAWKSSTGITAPSFFEPEGYGFLRGFFGGLLTTCGMTYSLHPCEDNGEKLGLHGRVSNIPAEDVSIVKRWTGDEYLMTVSGVVRETSVFGNKLVMRRSITTSLGSSRLLIEDEIENVGFTDSPLMMLYHVNIGWPVVSEHSRVVSPTRSVRPNDERAAAESDSWSKLIPPQPDYLERVYFHDMASDGDGMVRAGIVNDSRKLGVTLSYPKKDFPHFVQWKMMGQGEYVVGIEPTNSTAPRATMREQGTLEYVKPGATRKFTLEVGVLNGADSIENFESDVKDVLSS